MEMFFQVLSSQCSNTLLKRIILVAPSFIPTNLLDHTIDEGMLSPLLSFPDLTKLEICSYHVFKISNNALQKMAIAWRRLQIWEFGIGGWAGQSRVTLEGLAPLVQYCTELVHLGVVVDATIIDCTGQCPTAKSHN